LGLALDRLCHDRWVLGYLRAGWLQPIAASEVSRRFLQGRPLMPLARRALFEQRPTIMNALFENPSPSMGYDWEMDWPALLYAPVGDPGRRPIGLLVVGCRRDHWYSEDDIAFAVELGTTLAPLVAALRGPLGRLNESEGEVAQLLSYGLSAQEIARAMRVDDHASCELVQSVTKKLQRVNADELALPLEEMRPRRRSFRL
jgi:DNA-binding CsgD family transcriptional regulator